MPDQRRAPAAAYQRDPIAREQLIVQHLGLVHYAVGRLAIGLPSVVDREDLVAHGVIGLIQAIDRYDPTKGVPFAAWATIRIRGAILDAVRALDILTPKLRQQVRTLQSTTSALTSEFGRLPTDDEIQSSMALSDEEYAEVLQASSFHITSLDVATAVEGAPLADLIQATASDDPSERGAFLAMIGEAIRRLDDREKQVLSLYYVEDLTLQEIADVIGIHKSGIVRLHSRAIVKLRALLEVNASTDDTAKEIEDDAIPKRSSDRPTAHSGRGRPAVATDHVAPSSVVAAPSSASRRVTGARRAYLSGRSVELGPPYG